MGIHNLMSVLKERYPEYINEDPDVIDNACLLIVDIMDRLFKLPARKEEQEGNERGYTADLRSVRITGDEAFWILAGPAIKWLRKCSYSATVPGVPLRRRAILITDKTAWTPPEKIAEQKSRAAVMNNTAETEKVKGTYQTFVGPVHIDARGLWDAGAAGVTGVPTPQPFDPFSVLHQRVARNALLDFVRRRFASIELPPHAELVVDFGYGPPDVHAPHHSGGGDRCPISPAVVGHAHCGGECSEVYDGHGGLKRVAPAPRAITDDDDEIALYEEEDRRNDTDDPYETEECPANRFQRPSMYAGEAEVLAVHYALQYARALARVKDPRLLGANCRTICIQSADGDTFAAACNAFWDAPGGCRLLWNAKTAQTVHLTKVYRRLRTEGFTPERVLLACIAHGTDYAKKKDLFFFMNEQTVWTAAPNVYLPGEQRDGATEVKTMDGSVVTAASKPMKRARCIDDDAAGDSTPPPPQQCPSSPSLLARPVCAQRLRTVDDVSAAVYGMYVHATACMDVADPAVGPVAIRAREKATGRRVTHAEAERILQVHKHNARLKVPGEGKEFKAACARVLFNLDYWHQVAAMQPSAPAIAATRT